MTMKVLMGLNCICFSCSLLSMEQSAEQAVNYVFTETKWPTQIYKSISVIQDRVKSSITYYLPMQMTKNPIIAYAQCPCDNITGLSDSAQHQKVMTLMFNKILEEFRAHGFKHVICAAKLFERPGCMVKILPKLIGDRKFGCPEQEFDL